MCGVGRGEMGRGENVHVHFGQPLIIIFWKYQNTGKNPSLKIKIRTHPPRIYVLPSFLYEELLVLHGMLQYSENQEHIDCHERSSILYYTD